MFKKKSGIVFWITGLPGSGKTTLAKKVLKPLKNRYGPTIEISGDILRKEFSFKDYDLKSRKQYAKTYSIICNIIAKKGVNVIFSTVSLFHSVQEWNKKNINNYYEIFIDSKINKIIKLNKKKIYKRRNNLIGIDLKAEFPKKPNLKIKNNFNQSLNVLSKKILNNIFKKFK